MEKGDDTLYQKRWDIHNDTEENNEQGFEE